MDQNFAQAFQNVPMVTKTRRVQQLAFQLLFYIHFSAAALYTLEMAPAQCFFVVTPIQLFVWPSLLTIKQTECPATMKRGLVDVVKHVWLLAGIDTPIEELVDDYACGSVWRKICSDYLREKYLTIRSSEQSQLASALIVPRAEQERRDKATQNFHTQQITLHEAIYDQDTKCTLNDLDRLRRAQEQYLHEQRILKLDQLNQNYHNTQQKIQSHRDKLLDLHWQQSQRRFRNRIMSKH